MSNGWSAKELILSPDNVIAGVVTDQVVAAADGYAITAGGALNQVIRIVASGVAVTGAITAKLQTSIGTDWEDSKTVSITADGTYYIRLNVQVAGDQAFLPLLNKGRLVVTTTNAADEVTIDSVHVLQAL